MINVHDIRKNNHDLHNLCVTLISPRGLCAGVERAVRLVNMELSKKKSDDPPIYIRHDIVHNHHVVNEFKRKGVIFVEDLDEVKHNNSVVIFSAHGVSKAVKKSAQARSFNIIDGVCPLVLKVHKQVVRLHENGHFVFLVGHKNHPEVIGTMGQVPQNSISLITNTKDAETCHILPEYNYKSGYVTQTTLSLDETKIIIQILKRRFPDIISPQSQDICYATTNRQKAIQSFLTQAHSCDTLLIVGSRHSSNACRLVEVAKRYGCPRAYLLNSKRDAPWKEILHQDTHHIGISSGASTPEFLVQEIVQYIKDTRNTKIDDFLFKEEKIFFNI